MATVIDWHAHHTAPEIAERINQLTGKHPHIDAYDSPDLSKRVKEMDEVGIDLQLICQFFSTVPGPRRVRRSSASKTVAPASPMLSFRTARSPSAACA